MKFVTLVYSSSLLQCANHHGIGKGGLHEVHEPPKSWKSGKFAVFPLPSATVCTELNEIWYVYKRRRFALTWHIWPSSVKRWMWSKKTHKFFTKFWNIKESQPVQPLTLLGQMVSSIYLTAAAWNSSLLKIRQLFHAEFHFFEVPRCRPRRSQLPSHFSDLAVPAAVRMHDSAGEDEYAVCSVPKLLNFRIFNTFAYTSAVKRLSEGRNMEINFP